MGTYTTLTATVALGGSLPSEEKVRRWAEEKVEQPLDQLDVVVLRARGKQDQVGTRLVLTWQTKWEVEGVRDLARKLSRKTPDALVEWVSEWDTRDADEAGGEGVRYKGGEPIGFGSIGWHWADAPGAVR